MSVGALSHLTTRCSRRVLGLTVILKTVCHRAAELNTLGSTNSSVIENSPVIVMLVFS